MKCQDVRKELLSYLDGALTEPQANAVKEHLLYCSACSREFAAIQTTAQSVEAGLNNESQGYEKGSLGSWAIQRAKGLGSEEIARRRQWVASLRTSHIPQPQAARKSWGFSGRNLRAIALVAVLVLVLFVYWPNMVRVSAQMPLIGDWVRELVIKDAGLAWAYEHGYINEHLETASKDGVKLTILGAVTDPIQTTIIYLLEGREKPELDIYSTNWDNLPLYSLSSQQVKTPLGILELVYTDPLPAGAQQLRVVLKDPGLAMDIDVTRDSVSQVSREYKLDFEETVGDVTLKLKRIIYTPTQARVDFSVKGCFFDQGVFPIPNTLLMDGNGISAAEGSRVGSQSNYYWEICDIFSYPGNMRDLSLVICDWEFLIPVDFDFTPEDVGKEVAVAGSTMTLVAWERNGPVWGSEDILELHFKPDGLIRGVAKWRVDGFILPTMQESYKGNIVVGFRLPRDSKRVTASSIHFFVPGNWEIPLPGTE